MQSGAFTETGQGKTQLLLACCMGQRLSGHDVHHLPTHPRTHPPEHVGQPVLEGQAHKGATTGSICVGCAVAL